ncbi:DUF3617 domain-containing protein [Sphingobium algorifonticola]|uniref:DUF3617 family protein n=1 Tax=Sphingobium algorifonticola TaxID=2008318 RepID=A0A437JBF7_9SPHN|nr:DUF3617 family protein [Sphingobium algorifonticola]RVT43237.1 DUF3617 family protein [Sphingobium algorifonticola]
MRRYRLTALLTMALAGCNAEPAPQPKPEPAPVILQSGAWTFKRTQTGYNTPTTTAEDYARMVGSNSEAKLCLKVDTEGRPDADALAGREGTDCSYTDASIRKGRFIATLACKAGAGTSELVVEGNYKADSLTLGVSMTQTVGGKAVLRTTHDLSGKRTGDCEAE